MASQNELSDPEYWDKYYSTSKGHEWFQTFSSLEPFFTTHLKPLCTSHADLKVLHLGSGDSTIPSDLRKHYNLTNQTCLDFSEVVVRQMTAREDEILESANSSDGHFSDVETGTVSRIEWIQGDVRDMGCIHEKSIDVAFDKGTLDAMIHGSPWDPADDVKDNTARYLREVQRVLKPTGVFLYITYRQPHFVKPLLQACEWDMHMETLQTGASSFEYFAFVLRLPRDT